MHYERLRTLPQYGIALDTETHLIESGDLFPRLVCGSAGRMGQWPKIEGVLLPKPAALDAFMRALQDPNAVLIGANIAFDMGVVASEYARVGVDIMPQVFAAFEQGRVYDVQVAEALNAIADGNLERDPRTGGELKNPETGKKGSYSLATCVDLALGRKDAKALDEWRLRYAELENIPIEQWPQTARDYPIEDARNTGEVALAQAGHLPKHTYEHDWQTFTKPADHDGAAGAGAGGSYSQCAACGSTRLASPCIVRRRHENIHQVADQTYSAFCLHMGAAWGFHVDQKQVDKIENYVTRKRERTIQPFVDAGILWRDEEGIYHEDQALLKRLVAIAYGASEKCPHCDGTGEVPSPTQKPIRCTACKGWCLPDAKDGPKCKAWRAAHAAGLAGPTPWWCAQCLNTGYIPHPTPKMINCVIRGAVIEGSEATEGAKPEREDDTKTCDGTGFVLPPNLPRTEAGGVGIDKDTLSETGDEFLTSLAFFKDDAKLLKDYIPWLRTARACIACGQPGTHKKPHADGCAIAAAFTVVVTPATEDAPAVTRCDVPSSAYRDIALTPRPNVLLDTLRTSYRDYTQTFPRQGGFTDDETDEYIPSLRECIVARGASYATVEVPEDYVLQPGEERA